MLMSTLQSPYLLLLLIGALFVHVCYQVSVSVLTHFSSHSLSRKTSEKRLLALGSSYSFGAVAMTTLVLITLMSIGHTSLFYASLPYIIVVLAIAIGIATTLWYYRQGPGTQLWLPRAFANYLLERSESTKSCVEAFMLGAATVVAELPFIIAPLMFAAYLGLDPIGDIPFALTYSVVACLPLFVITGYITSGHSVARVQKWREDNKVFLQWTSGIALLLLSLYFVSLQFGELS